ncbi:nucleotidyltransferase family protein [Thalassospira alkalitolerans]|uniref:nucleotidyltransferase family protein n=1 Tax=Thalassospira alkalitolerans TaxID=1293890 RepID=UPI001FE6A9FA|nr:nucleotidyltransferase family protein [Thalassospira alkalitolerans]
MKIAGLILAAGESTRFGGRKQLAKIDGKPMLGHAIDQLSPIFGDDLFVVLGAFRDEITSIIGDQAKIIANDNWQFGMGSSIACGIAGICANGTYDGVMIALGDQVGLQGRDYKKLISAFNGSHIIASRYNEMNGVPAAFPATCFPELAMLGSHRGAQQLLNSGSHDISAIAMPNAALDIDTRDDLKQLIGLDLGPGPIWADPPLFLGQSE